MKQQEQEKLKDIDNNLSPRFRDNNRIIFNYIYIDKPKIVNFNMIFYWLFAILLPFILSTVFIPILIIQSFLRSNEQKGTLSNTNISTSNCFTEIPSPITITPTGNSLTADIVLTFYPIDPTIKQKLTYNCTVDGEKEVTCNVDIKPLASGEYILTHADFQMTREIIYLLHLRL